MHYARMALLGSAMWSFLAVGCGGSMLHAVADESSTELQVAQHLQARGLPVSIVEPKPGDKAIVMDLVTDRQAPALRVVVDTQISAKDIEEHIRSRVVRVMLLSRVMVPRERREAVLSVINTHHYLVWAGCFYVSDKDGELEAQWPVNIGSEYAVASEQVGDALMRLIQSWQVLRPKVLDAIKPGSVPAPSPAAAPTTTA